jgi:bacterioferritin
MKPGKNGKAIIEILNDVLTAELTAINQYFLHSEMCENWGYEKLHGIMRKHAIDEMRHAEVVIERVLFFEGFPNVQRLGNITIGESVPEMHRLDLALEQAAVKRLNDGVEICGASGDNGTRALLEKILESEEEHVEWLEAQLELIKQVGAENYLAQQIKEGGAS